VFNGSPYEPGRTPPPCPEARPFKIPRYGTHYLAEGHVIIKGMNPAKRFRSLHLHEKRFRTRRCRVPLQLPSILMDTNLWDEFSASRMRRIRSRRQPQMPPADFILYNAIVYTMDDAQPRASALAVCDNHFVDVGRCKNLFNTYPDARRIDAGQRTVVPGFIDAHAHLQDLGLSLHRADVSGARSADAVVDRLLSFTNTQDPTNRDWLLGHGWDETEWTSGPPPARPLLDSAFPNRPVWLTRTDVHAGWANTAALERTVSLARLRRMGNPDGGAIRRDARGRPTGILVDSAMALVEDHIPPTSPEQRDRALSTALEHTARHGITGLHDAGVDRPTIRRFQRFIDEDAFPLRVSAMIDQRGDTFDFFCDRGPYQGPHGRLQVAAVKFFADGALGSRGAALLEAYADDPGNDGLLRQSPDALRADVRPATECGFQVCTHAIGDRANRIVLDAYEAAREAGMAVRRPRIEHAQVLHPQDLPRFGSLDVIASVQPIHATSDMDWVVDRLGPQRTDGAYAWNSLRSAGARLAFGSDAPVEPIDPLRGLHAAVTRQDDDGLPPTGWHPSERISRSTALYAYTEGAAYAACREDVVGSITPGKRADFVVLSQDIMEIPPTQLLDTRVLATYLDGTPTYVDSEWPVT